MGKQATFGNADLARKMASRFGTSQESVKAEMRYAKEVRLFLRKVEEAHEKAAESKLIFG